MAYYEELSPIVNNIIGEKILRNQNICKLLSCYPDGGSTNIDNFPELNFSVYSQPDIENPNELFFKNVFPLPKIPEAETKQETYILVNLSGGYDVDSNTGYRRINLLIDVISHLKCWHVKEGYRPYLIMSEIDKILNNQITDLPIENKPYSRGFQPRDYQNYFYGLQMIYELNVNSNVICSPIPQNLNTENKLSYLPRSFKANRVNSNETDN